MMWSYLNNNSIAMFDEGWQYPAITEKHAAYKLKALKNIELPFQYIGFPWATLTDFDNRQKKNDVEDWLKRLNSFTDYGFERKITVAQHISTFKKIPFFKKVGITDIFWTHATTDQYLIDGVRIHPFPLYPVQVPKLDMVNQIKNIGKSRKFLFSFIGAYDPKGYLSDIRKRIIEEMVHLNAKIVLRKEWHYEKIVYQKQISNNELSIEQEKELSNNSEEYKDVLRNSTFSICPSGSGPNSIRLWESIGALSIPVIFTNNLRLPGDQSLWEKSTILIPENVDNLNAIIKKLEILAENEKKIKEMREGLSTLWLRYGPHNFIFDIKKLANIA